HLSAASARTVALLEPRPQPAEAGTPTPAANAEPEWGGSEEQQPPPATDTGIRGPRSPVTAEALEQLGIIVISGNNQADVEEVIKIIDYLRRLGAPGDVQIQLFRLDHADPAVVANVLTRLFTEVIVSPSGNRFTPVVRQSTALPGATIS